METYIGVYGEISVPKEKRGELGKRIKKLMFQGGMMQFNKIDGLTLISPVEYDSNRELHFAFNYFEDERYEPSGYSAESTEINCCEVGNKQFSWVLLAAQVLQEFYSETFGVTECNGFVIDASEPIGWINHLFKERYTNVRTQDLWKIHKLLRDNAPRQNLFNIIEDGALACRSAAGELKYTLIEREDYFYKALKCLEEEDGTPEARFSPIYCIKRMRSPLEKFRDVGEGTREEKLDLLKKVLTTDVPDVWQLPLNEDSKWFAILAKLIPWEFSVKFIADVFEMDFWKLHDEIEPNAMPCKITWIDLDIEEDFSPIAPIKTARFLRITDDDRAFYWTQDSDVEFSEEMMTWMKELKAELNEIMSGDGQLIDPAEFALEFRDVLYQVFDIFHNLYFFKHTYIEFVERADERPVQAAVILLKRMKNRYQNNKDKQVQSEGRMKIKRYVAILANKELRKVMLEF